MSANVYALLVGINEYPSHVGRLSGCINDVEHVHEYLRGRFAPSKLFVETLLNGDATRQGMIDQFRHHLSRAGADDVVLFHYSGHGARWKSAQEFTSLFPDGMDEGLVCADSRLAGGYDLADKELAVLLAEVAGNCPHVAVILDCCHSGSGTRSADDFTQLKARQTHEVQTERPLESYLDGYYAALRHSGASMEIPVSRHILLAGCQRVQKAWEGRDHSGLFTSSLLEVLRRSGGELSYADLFLRCRAEVRRRADNQEPQFETYRGFPAWQGFLGGRGNQSGRRHTVAFEKNRWTLNCGAIHGLPSDPDEAVSLDLYREGNPSQLAARATTSHVGAQSSELTILEGSADVSERFQAEITSLPVPPLEVALEGDDAATAALEQFFRDADDQSLGVSLLRESQDIARYVVSADEGTWSLRLQGGGRLIQGVRGYSREAADYLFSVLKRVAAWERAVSLQNHWSRMKQDDVPFWLSEVSEQDEVVREFPDNSVTIDIIPEQEFWSSFRGTLRAKNLTQQPLHLLLVHLSDDYGMQVLYNDRVEPTESSFTITLDGNAFFDLTLDDHEGDESVHIFKLIVSTEKVDDFLLGQEPLQLGTILDLEETRGTRGLSFGQPRRKLVHEQEWFTQDVQVTLVRERETLTADDITLAGGVVHVVGHPQMRAGVRLTARNAEFAGRGATGSEVHRVFERLGMEHINFAKTRGDNLSVLELTNIQHAESLAEHPLEIALDIALTDEESVLPIVFDGEDILIGGAAARDEKGRTRILISNIPECPDRQRGIGQSLKLYFFKTVLRQENVNRLDWISFKADGNTTRQGVDVAEKVRTAKNILLLLPGILGDTTEMANGLQVAQDVVGQRLHQNFDLVLAYHYESLSTPLVQTALQLKRQLREVGIHEGDDKRLTVMAHSVGGLIARWWIEQDGGKSAVDHLIMFGTPNDGSPLGQIGAARNITTLLTTLAMNVNPLFAAWGGPLIYLLNGSEKPTVTLEELNPQSEIIRTLSASEDPGVRYTIISGDFHAARQQQGGVLARLAGKLGGEWLLKSLHQGETNDIAVSGRSATSIDDCRSPPPDKRRVPCHHLSYFTSDAGLEHLAKIDWRL
ncbi:MAG: caspase family protein [Planctomycetaceae bacterium]